MSAEGFESIASFLPLQSSEGELRWNSQMRNALISVAKGHPTSPRKSQLYGALDSGKQTTSQVNSAVALCDFLKDLRKNSDLEPLHPRVFRGILSFFDEFEPQEEFFSTTLPKIATLTLELPSLLKSHEGETEYLRAALSVPTQLRILLPQEPGIVVLRQHLVAALLACGFLCLYPEKVEQQIAGLSSINFDGLYIGACGPRKCSCEKLRCLLNFFTREGSYVTNGWVSFERKVLPLQHIPADDFWSNSKKLLCRVKVDDKGRIEDAGPDYLKVDFADRQLGGETLRVDFAQEEVIFMLYPECIAGMLFLPTMSENESIEIAGAERVTTYSGYQDTFKLLGDYNDNTRQDDLRRRQTHVIAIDALCLPGEDQFKNELMIRELNKAYCGFSCHSTLCNFNETVKPCNAKERRAGGSEDAIKVVEAGHDIASRATQASKRLPHCENPAFSTLDLNPNDANPVLSNLSDDETVVCKHGTSKMCHIHEKQLGVATGNWGSGVFGGDLQLKSILQWMSASEAECPSVIYYSFGDERARGLQEVVDWTRKKGWSVSELWKMVKQYSKSRATREVHSELFDWILHQAGCSPN